MMRRAFVLLLVAVLAGGCAAALEPGPGAAAVGGIGKGAIAEQAGVRVAAHAQAWRGYPASLRGVVTPMLVTIDNGSEHPLRVRYDQFDLEAPDGRVFAAVPPFDITSWVSEPAGYEYAYAYAPGPGPGPWSYPYPWRYPGWWPAYSWPFYDPWYYDRYGPAFRQVELPTGDMIQKALPESVVEPGGRASGFVYFQDVRKVSSAVFTLRLIDARTGQPFGTIHIPFVVD